MTNETLLIGIDIGWSERQRSCAMAVRDVNRRIEWPPRAKFYGGDGLVCCRFRLSELMAFLQRIQAVPGDYQRTVLVLDGPLGPSGRPTKNRAVDSSFRRGEFRYRMQPADVGNAVGQEYVNATYTVAEYFAEVVQPWMGGPTDSKLIIAETNPTVGLALLTQKYAISEIPSRKRPLVPPAAERGERSIRAKSDFYWRVGANLICSSILDSAEIAAERNHENVAGLYCLAVASAISTGSAVSCGDEANGAYIFPSEVHSDWRVDLQQAGAISGHLETLPIPEPVDLHNWFRAIPAFSPIEVDVGTNDQDRDGATDCVDVEDNKNCLLLCDNGGVWQQHNNWLDGASGPVKVQCIPTQLVLELKRASEDGHWTVAPTALTVARRHGFSQSHLSREHSIAIEIEILDLSL